MYSICFSGFISERLIKGIVRTYVDNIYIVNGKLNNKYIIDCHAICGLLSKLEDSVPPCTPDTIHYRDCVVGGIR